MKLTIKLNDEIITRDVNAYVIQRELSQYIGEGKKMCNHCSHLMTCNHNSVDKPSIKRAVKVGDKEAIVTECGDYSSISGRIFNEVMFDSDIPLTEGETVLRYADAFSASIAHPTVNSYVSHMR